jgi:hypothetical protein
MAYLWKLQVLHQSTIGFPKVEDFPRETHPDEQDAVFFAGGRMRLSLRALQSLDEAASERELLNETLFFLQQFYQNKRTQRTSTEDAAAQMRRPSADVGRALCYLSELPIFIKPEFDPNTGHVSVFALSDVVRAVSLWSANTLPEPPRHWNVQSLAIDGYKPFLRASLPISPQTALIGESGAGKTCALAAWQFLRYAVSHALPESFDPWWSGKIFTTSAPEAIRLGVEISLSDSILLYELEIHGEGPPKIFRESCRRIKGEEVSHLLAVTAGRGVYLSNDCASRPLPFLSKPNETWMYHSDTLQNPWLSALRSFLLKSKSYFSVSPMDLSAEKEIIECLSALSNEAQGALQHFLQSHIKGFNYYLVRDGRLLCKETKTREEVLWIDTAESFRRLFFLSAYAHSDATLFTLDTPHRGVSPEYHPLVDTLLKQMSTSAQVLASLDQALPGFDVVRLSAETGRPLAKNS